ncbi:MAG TPA: long-chain fatty acid--CoA ligase [Actinomycetota bacterium]|nr:long-chain fatty acid--CoA ligase [Actinomycetota bacterium]
MSMVQGATLVELFNNRVAATPDNVWLKTKAGEGWQGLTYGEASTQAQELANGLIGLGVGPGSAVSLLGKNRAEWMLSDVAILLAGGRTAPVYTTNSPRQAGHVIANSESTVVIVEDAEQRDKVLKVRDELPGLSTIVVMTGEGAGQYPGVISYEELRAGGRTVAQEKPEELKARMAAPKPGDVATLVYTSGTTGEPKGAMLTHDNFVKTMRASIDVMHLDNNEAHRLISYLPLSHIFERLVGEWTAIGLGAEVWFAESIDKLVANLKECRPTLFIGVPRVYEKFYSGIRARLGEQPVVKRVMATKAIEAGTAKVKLEQGGHPVPGGLARKQKFLDHLVNSKLRHELGMDACRLAVSGAAPLSPEVMTFVHALGITLVEGYGLTETTAPISVNPSERIRIGTVGPPLPGVQVKFDTDGELLVKGYNVFAGYYKNEEATAAAFTGDGFFRTGDVGEFDAAGYIKITDRKKDLIVTAGGKNVAPQVLEERLKFDPIISQALVIGDRRPYLVALLTLDPEAVAKWAADNGVSYSDVTDLSANPKLLDEVKAMVERVNGELSRQEGIKRWTVLPRDFSQDAEEITPTLKVRRKIITEKYSAEIERLYS